MVSLDKGFLDCDRLVKINLDCIETDVGSHNLLNRFLQGRLVESYKPNVRPRSYSVQVYTLNKVTGLDPTACNFDFFYYDWISQSDKQNTVSYANHYNFIGSFTELVYVLYDSVNSENQTRDFKQLAETSFVLISSEK